MPTSYVPLDKLVVLFCALLAVGLVLTIPLYKFNIRKFLKSKLFIKIIFWVPIFLVLLGVLYANQQVRLAVLLVLILAAFSELFKRYKSKYQWLLIIYYALFVAFLGHFYFIATTHRAEFINLLITIAFATVLADVVAFFSGNYFGRHKLPESLNKNKSWEGVLGEIAGAFIGVVLVNAFVEPVLTIWLFVPIGAGSIIGDLANSYVKRRLKIKDWSEAIPGHGGFIDRLSSIAGSVASTVYYLKISGL